MKRGWVQALVMLRWNTYITYRADFINGAIGSGQVDMVDNCFRRDLHRHWSRGIFPREPSGSSRLMETDISGT
jgi:hypothetical protein